MVHKALCVRFTSGPRREPGPCLFTDAERERLSRFPRDVPPADLLTSFTLSDDELELIDDRRSEHNRLGFSLQLKTLPYLGSVPDYLVTAPARVVAYLALQLNVSGDALRHKTTAPTQAARGSANPTRAAGDSATLSRGRDRQRLRSIQQDRAS